MLQLKDIEKLAELARLDIPAGEKEDLLKEVDSILGYVGEIQKLSGGLPAETLHSKVLAGESKKVAGSPAQVLRSKISVGEVRNIFRSDENPHLPGEFTKELIEEAPRRQDGYIKVKRIL